MIIPVVYSEKMNAVSGDERSPSARKPAAMAQYLKDNPSDAFTTAFVEPRPMILSDFYRCHNATYVDSIMQLKAPNGFGSISESVVKSLPYTNGAMYTAAKIAIKEDVRHGRMPTAALVSGFHHAGFGGFGGLGHFCTFNGLMATASKLVHEDGIGKVAIVDCDYHVGNGTEDIISWLDKNCAEWAKQHVFHFTFGRYFRSPDQAEDYLEAFQLLRAKLLEFDPEVILYQSGADVHVDDPYGGILNEDQMYERDKRMFAIAAEIGWPIAWALAGGYQIARDGNIDKVLKLHYNTFKACAEADS